MPIKILIVEDEEILRRAYKTKLSLLGYDVSEAFDGSDALKKVDRIEPDVILLDLLMPNMDGISFLRAYDVKSKHPTVKVLVFSNWYATEKVKEAMDLGAIKYLVKANLSPNELIKIIKEVTGEKNG